MSELNKSQIKEIAIKLKPFGKKHRELQLKFSEEIEKLKEEMNNSLDFGINLEFFYVDGECVGVGAENYSDRKNFPLIYDKELDEWN